MIEKQTPYCEGLRELQQVRQLWGVVEDGLPWHTPTSVLQKVRTRGGVPAFLKIALCEEERRGAAVLRWWDGQGAVRVLAQHNSALLLEGACGNRSLAHMSREGKDEDASHIICAVADSLHNRKATNLPELMPLAHCFRSLAMAASTLGGIWGELSTLASALLSAPQHVVVLHGDLHHENILDAGSRGWLAIDPKGYLGERGFDFANIFCNPDYPTATQPALFENRLNTVAEAARLERPRLLAWIAAWAGLSAAWHTEDGGNPSTALAVATLALAALQR